MRIVTVFLVSTLLLSTGCSLGKSSSMLVLEPELLATQSVTQGHSQSVTVSRQFHTVEVSPHPVLAPDREWRFYLQITNGSALDTNFDPRNIMVLRNGTPLTPLKKDEIRQRILNAKTEALREIAAQSDPMRASRRDLNVDAPSDLSAGQFIEDMRRHDAEIKEQRQQVEQLTKRKLETLESYALDARTLKPGERYQTFLEVPLTTPVAEGDEFVVRIGIEPDVHEFRYRIASL